MVLYFRSYTLTSTITAAVLSKFPSGSELIFKYRDEHDTTRHDTQSQGPVVF